MTPLSFAAFESAAYPCFLLDNDGHLHSNAKARTFGKPFSDEAAMLRLLQTAVREYAQRQEEGAFVIPLLSDALSMHQLTLMPTADGFLAVAQQDRQAAVDAFSNQMREPLTNIFATLPLLSMHMSDTDLHYAESIQANCYQLLRLANNIENAAHIERKYLHAQPIDLVNHLDALCQSVQTVSRQCGVPIQWQLPGQPVPVKTDLRLFSSAILNVIRNSLQFTRDNNEIMVRLQCTGANALLTIEDRGIGIKPENLGRIFEPYFSADPYGDSPIPPGVGLGLAVVRQTIYGFGGTVNAESRFGEGTRIFLSLPLDTDNEETLQSEPADYLMNRYSSVYIQLCGYCRLPNI